MIDCSLTPRISGARHWSADLNQLYHPTGVMGEGSQDLVYAFNVVSVTKFTPLFLKEWFYLLRPNGCLVIDYFPSSLCDWQRLEEMMWWLWKHKYEIVFHGPVEKKEIENLNEGKIVDFIRQQEEFYRSNLNERTLLPTSPMLLQCQKGAEDCRRFVCRKNISTAVAGDTIDRWSFGIVTSGTRKDWLDNIIASIRRQKIPEYEIIICGTYFDRKEDDCRYIPFNQRDDRGWITKKKNIIGLSATFNNLCILHDRMFLDDHWHAGMKQWGNCFEVLAVPQLFVETQGRFGDWVCNEGFSVERANDLWPLRGGYLEYRDWHPDVPSYAAVTIAKKHIFSKNRFNETLYWGNQFDDLLLHQDMHSNGYVLRMNPSAITYSMTKSVIGFEWHHEFNDSGLGLLRHVNPVLKVGCFLLSLFRIKKNSRFLSPLKSFLKKRFSIQTHRSMRSAASSAPVAGQGVAAP